MLKHTVLESLGPVQSMTSTKQDYRSLILREFDIRKRRNPAYSFRAFARDLKLTPSHLTGVLQGQKGISASKAFTVQNTLKLNTTDQLIFTSSVAAQHARSSHLRNTAVEKWNQASLNSEFKNLSLDRFKVIASWHHYAILELWHLKSFICTPQWIAKAIGISVLEAELALDKLQRVGLLEKGNDGILCPSSKNNAAGENVPSQALRQHHQQVLEKAQSAIEGQSVDQRDLSSMTMAIDAVQLPRAKELIKDFRRKFDQLMSESVEKDSVYCLAIQFFEYTQFTQDKNK